MEWRVLKETVDMGVSLIDASIFDAPANCRDYPTLLDASLAVRPASTTWSQVSAQLPRRTTVLNLYTLRLHA